jgi:hypothetical protein
MSATSKALQCRRCPAAVMRRLLRNMSDRAWGEKAKQRKEDIHTYILFMYVCMYPTEMTVRIRTQKCMTELFLLKELGERTEVENNLESDKKSDNKNRALDLPHTVTTAGVFPQFLYYHLLLVQGRAGSKLRKSQESKSKSELGSGECGVRVFVVRSGGGCGGAGVGTY